MSAACSRHAKVRIPIRCTIGRVRVQGNPRGAEINKLAGWRFQSRLLLSWYDVLLAFGGLRQSSHARGWFLLSPFKTDPIYQPKEALQPFGFDLTAAQVPGRNR